MPRRCVVRSLCNVKWVPRHAEEKRESSLELYRTRVQRNGTKMSEKKSQRMLNSIFRKPSPTRHTIAREHFLERKAFRNVVRTTTDGEHERRGRERRSVEEKAPPVMLLFHAKNYSNSNFSINRPQKCSSDRGNPLNHYSQSSCTDSANKISYSVWKRHKNRMKALGARAQAPTLAKGNFSPTNTIASPAAPLKNIHFSPLCVALWMKISRIIQLFAVLEGWKMGKIW